MNNVSLVGRFTRDPEVWYTDGGSSVARFNLAVDRRFKKEGQPDADFPSCVAFGKTAEFIEKYFHKGQRMGLVGRIQTGSYTKEDGTKVYTTDVVAENVEFVESKSSGSGQGLPPEPSIAEANDGWVNVPDDIDEELPFN
jgi:single-strand DNA-binding protein